MARTAKTAARKVGRPSRGEEAERRDGLLTAALDIFLKQGFSGTSLDDIARAARVAKRTIYEQFGGKEGLFASAIERSATRLVVTLPSIAAAGGELGPALMSIGRAVLDLVLQPGSLAIYRLVAGEAKRQPKLAQIFYEHGPARVIASVAERLAGHMQQGRIQKDDPVTLARRFIGLVVLEIHQRAVLGVLSPMSSMEREQHVAAGVTLFLAALGTTSGPVEPRSRRNGDAPGEMPIVSLAADISNFQTRRKKP
jgi:AcrR family transcriptional regulator